MPPDAVVTSPAKTFAAVLPTDVISFVRFAVVLMAVPNAALNVFRELFDF